MKKIFITGRMLGTVVAGSLAASMLTAAPALAADGTEEGSSTVSVRDISTALENLTEGYLQSSIDAQEVPESQIDESTSLLSNAEEQLTVQIPEVADDGVSLTVGDFSLGISLPNASQAGSATQLNGGAVAYPAEGDSANAVIPTSGGAQLLSIIENEKASESYPYDLDMPAGHTLEATADGGAQVIDDQGVIKVVFEPAWARDANDAAVPTRYVVEGNTLTQIVDHRNAENVAYPVVADPLPLVVIVVVTVAMIVVAAAALGIATWLVVSWWNTCRAKNMYPQLSNVNGFTARCVR